MPREDSAPLAETSTSFVPHPSTPPGPEGEIRAKQDGIYTHRSMTNKGQSKQFHWQTVFPVIQHVLMMVVQKMSSQKNSFLDFKLVLETVKNTKTEDKSTTW